MENFPENYAVPFLGYILEKKRILNRPSELW